MSSCYDHDSRGSRSGMTFPDTRQDRIDRCLQTALELSSDVAALAYMAHNPSECLELTELLDRAIQMLHERQMQIGRRADLCCGGTNV